ncbi:MAG: LysM peptidoglycan-binding domain-containing protein [Verrucomicrobiales bacterium]|nr:LysM peptidoglycan-binding domain-containing protein [Verrucomicrobiales bacterium]
MKQLLQSNLRRLRVFALVTGLGISVAGVAQPLTVAQARALQEEFTQRYERLNGLMQDMVDSQAALNKRVDALAGELRDLRSTTAGLPPNAVTQEQLRDAVETLRVAINKQQAEQGRKITGELEQLRKLLEKGGAGSASPPRETTPKEGYDYTINPGDTISAIVEAYRAADPKLKDLSVDMVLKANKGLKPERLIPGTKIFIPDPGKH